MFLFPDNLRIKFRILTRIALNLLSSWYCSVSRSILPATCSNNSFCSAVIWRSGSCVTSAKILFYMGAVKSPSPYYRRCFWRGGWPSWSNQMYAHMPNRWTLYTCVFIGGYLLSTAELMYGIIPNWVWPCDPATLAITKLFSKESWKFEKRKCSQKFI